MILAEDIFQILADSLHYPEIKEALDNLTPWQRKDLTEDMDNILMKAFEDESLEGIKTGKLIKAEQSYLNGLKDGRKSALQGIVDGIFSFAESKNIPVKPHNEFERLSGEFVLIDGKYYKQVSDEESVNFIWGKDED